jgi:hypothetical protein
LATALAFSGCAGNPRPAPPPPPPDAPGVPEAPPPPVQLPPSLSEDDLTVKSVAADIIVAAWAEPSKLPVGGGPVQILVRVQRRGGRPYPGVEVRLRASKGMLFSAGRTLVTDARGLTRDRLTAQGSAVITLNAGGTRYRFTVAENESP